MRSPQFAQSKGIQDGLEFWDSIRWLRIPGTRFQSLSVELEFPILIVSGIPDPLIPVSSSHFTSKHFPCSLTWNHTVETQIQGRSRRDNVACEWTLHCELIPAHLQWTPGKPKNISPWLVQLRPAYEYFHVQWRQRNVQIGIATFYRHQSKQQKGKRLKVSRYFGRTSRPSSGDVIENRKVVTIQIL